MNVEYINEYWSKVADDEIKLNHDYHYAVDVKSRSIFLTCDCDPEIQSACEPGYLPGETGPASGRRLSTVRGSR